MKQILIIEDDKEIAGIERDYLELSGYGTTIAEDGTEGMRLALTGDFDLILMDVMLPGLDGFEICRRRAALFMWYDREKREWQPWKSGK